MQTAFIIPSQGRWSLPACLSSIRSSDCQLPIFVCTSASSRSELKMLSDWCTLFDADLLVANAEEFSKPKILNFGVHAAASQGFESIITSDVDIIWNRRALLEIEDAAGKDSLLFCSSVIETISTEPSTIPVLSITISGQEVLVERNLQKRLTKRPGYGLQCFSTSLFERLSGFSTSFNGWGWEDVDFLLRAYSAGASIDSFSELIHITHESTRPMMSQKEREDVILSRAAMTLKRICAEGGPQARNPFTTEVRELMRCYFP